MKISIIGVGRLGGALALALAKDFEIEHLVVRKRANAEKIARIINAKLLIFEEVEKIASDVLVIATRDSEIEKVAGNLAGKLKVRPIIFHTSGSLSSRVLQNLKKIGCPTGSFHPLVSLSDPFLGKERFKGAYFCIEGSTEAVRIAEKIVEKLEGRSFSIETKYKSLYHASAVTACGHLVALIDTAIEMLARCGLESSEAKKILLPLVESTLENLTKQTPAEALTGTFARAEVEIFKKHLKTIRDNVSEEALETYLQLGERSLHLAEEQNVSRENLEKLRREILLAKKKLRC